MPTQGSSDFCVDPDTYVRKMVGEHSVLSEGESAATSELVFPRWAGLGRQEEQVNKAEVPLPWEPWVSGWQVPGQETGESTGPPFPRWRLCGMGRCGEASDNLGGSQVAKGRHTAKPEILKLSQVKLCPRRRPGAGTQATWEPSQAARSCVGAYCSGGACGQGRGEEANHGFLKASVRPGTVAMLVLPALQQQDCELKTSWVMS